MFVFTFISNSTFTGGHILNLFSFPRSIFFRRRLQGRSRKSLTLAHSEDSGPCPLLTTTASSSTTAPVRWPAPQSPPNGGSRYVFFKNRFQIIFLARSSCCPISFPSKLIFLRVSTAGRGQRWLRLGRWRALQGVRGWRQKACPPVQRG